MRRIITEADISDNVRERIIISEASHSQAMQYMRDILKIGKDDVATVKFIKSNGKVRVMDVHFDDDFMNAMIQNSNSPKIVKIKKTNKLRDNMVVCELLPSGHYQFRTIPLRKVLSVRQSNRKV